MHEFYDIIIIDAVFKTSLVRESICSRVCRTGSFVGQTKKQEVNAWLKRTRGIRG